MSVTLNQCQSDILPSNNVQNPKNDSHYFSITTHSSKNTIDPTVFIVDKARNDVVSVDEAHEEEPKKLVTSEESSQKLIGVDKSVKKDKEKGNVTKPVLNTIPCPTPLFHRD